MNWTWLVLLVFLLNALHAQEKYFGPWTYIDDGQSVTIVRTYVDYLHLFNGQTNPIIVPETIENLPVKKFGIETSFSSGFQGITNIQSVVLPNTLEEVGPKAFYGCTGLTNIVLPNSLKKIGTEAFRSCTNLPTITLPAGITNIESGVFWDSRKLDNIVLPAGLKTLGSWAFAYCTGLTQIKLNSGLETIGNYAFLGNTSLSSINIPSSVVSIGDQAFLGNTSLTNVIVGSNVSWIGWEAFANCSNLTKVIFRGSPPNGGVEPFSRSSGTVYYQSDIAGWGLKYPPVGYRGPNGLPTISYTSDSVKPKIKFLGKTNNSFFINWENDFEASFGVKLPVNIQKNSSLSQTNWVNISENSTAGSYQDFSATDSSAFYRIQVP